MSPLSFSAVTLRCTSAAALRPPPRGRFFSCWKTPSDPPASPAGPRQQPAKISPVSTAGASGTPHAHTHTKHARRTCGHTLQVPRGSYTHTTSLEMIHETMALPCAAGLALPARRALPVSSPAAGRRPSARGGRLGHPAPQPQRSLTGGTARSQRAAGPGRPRWAGPAAAPRRWSRRRRSPPSSPLLPDSPAGHPRGRGGAPPAAPGRYAGASGAPQPSVHVKVKAKLRLWGEGCLRSIEREGFPHFPTPSKVSRHTIQVNSHHHQ